MYTRAGTATASPCHLIRQGETCATKTATCIPNVNSRPICGQSGNTCAPRCASDLEVHAVRCCSSSVIQGWNNTFCSDVWQESDLWSEGCQYLNFRKASAFCISKGGRLCTDTEIMRNCVHDSGCNMDSKMVWTSDSKHGVFKQYARTPSPEHRVWKACWHGAAAAPRGTCS